MNSLQAYSRIIETVRQDQRRMIGASATGLRFAMGLLGVSSITVAGITVRNGSLD